ncbi:MAG: hypothetical protein AB1861_19085 [Cyanobacteriota bacterium]
MIDVTRGIFDVSRLVPVELFSGLGQLYYEQPAAFGRREVEKMAIDLLAERSKKPGDLTSIDLITVNYEEEFFDLLSRRLSENAGGTVRVRIITTRQVAVPLRRLFGDSIGIACVDRPEALRCERFLIINKAIGMLYQRIPASGFERANIAQIIDSAVEIQLTLNVFESLYHAQRAMCH